MTACPSALPASPLQDNRQCGVYNSAYEGHWQSLSCESALPYICKKTINDARRAEPLGESLPITPDLLGPLNGLFMSLLKKCIGGYCGSNASPLPSTAVKHLGKDLSPSLRLRWLQPQQLRTCDVNTSCCWTVVSLCLNGSFSSRELAVRPHRMQQWLVAT